MKRLSSYISLEKALFPQEWCEKSAGCAPLAVRIYIRSATLRAALALGVARV